MAVAGHTPRRTSDCVFTKNSPDLLEHATSEIAIGSKLGIDATKKLPGDGFDEALAICKVPEDRFATVTAIHDVVDRAGSSTLNSRAIMEEWSAPLHLVVKIKTPFRSRQFISSLAINYPTEVTPESWISQHPKQSVREFGSGGLVQVEHSLSTQDVRQRSPFLQV